MEHDTDPDRGRQPVPFTRRRGPRSDAARNRARLLAAARALLADRPLEEITTDQLAGAAGVGKATLYRAFGDKAGLARALLDDDERTLQEAILTGPPPLGPGEDVGPLERIEAFVAAYAALLERDADLLLFADAGTTARFRTGAYEGWALHLRTQLTRLATDADEELAAHAILALLAPELHVHLRREAGYSARRFTVSVTSVATRIAAGAPAGPSSTVM